MIEGFDASGWSGLVDCVAAKTAGKQYAIFRVGRGIKDGATDANGIDKFWFINKRNAINAGLPVGGYWRFFPSVDQDIQVNRFVLALSQQPGMLSPWVDIEDTGGLNATQLTTWAIQVLTKVEERCGRRPVLYTGKNFYDNNLEYQRLANWELAIAWQRTGKWSDYGACFWQYLLDTSVPWATGRVDLQKYAFDDLKYNTFQNELRYQIDEDGMLHGPMVWSDKLLPESGSQGTQSNKVAIVHTMVGYLNGTDAYFRRGDIVLESTLGIGGKYDGAELDGAIYQWMRSYDQADANYNARPYAFSIETSDGGGNRYLEKWSPPQAESLSQALAAWCVKYNRPARLVNRSHSSVEGIGHHRIGTVPYPKPGDDYWSPPSEGPRACPGQPRIDQLTNEVIPRVQQIVNSLTHSPGGGGGNPEPEEPDMQLNDVLGVDKDGRPITVEQALLAIIDVRDMVNQLDAASSDQLDQRAKELRTSLNAKMGQATWEDLASTTWNDLASQRWDKLNTPE